MTTTLKPGPVEYKPLPNPSQYGLGWGRVFGPTLDSKREVTRLIRRCPSCRDKRTPVSYRVKVKGERVTHWALACRCNPHPAAESLANGTYLP